MKLFSKKQSSVPMLKGFQGTHEQSSSMRPISGSTTVYELNPLSLDTGSLLDLLEEAPATPPKTTPVKPLPPTPQKTFFLKSSLVECPKDTKESFIHRATQT
jgi:hypothetical protein